MATTNVLVTRTGTGWTVDVTACDLDPDTNIKDFIVLVAGSVVPNSSFAKTTQTTLTYNGAALGAGTQVEVRRKTPNTQKSIALLGSRVRSSDWNAEFDRVIRHFEEYDLNGAGSPVQAPIPKDEPFGSGWDGDTVYPPSRNAAYDYLITLAPLSNPVFTGSPKAPTQATGDNSTNIATTAYVKSNLTSYATLASPSFTGSPTVPTAANNNNSTLIANTAWVQTFISGQGFATTANVTTTLAAYATLASPAFTGAPTVPTAALGTNTTQAASTAFVAASQRPYVDAHRATSTQSFANNALTTVIFNVENVDTNNAYNPSTGEFTVPAGLGGTYEIKGFLAFTANATLFVVEVFVNGSPSRRVGQSQAATDAVTSVSIVGSVRLNAGDVVTIRLYQLNGSAANRDLLISSPHYNWLTINRTTV